MNNFKTWIKDLNLVKTFLVGTGIGSMLFGNMIVFTIAIILFLLLSISGKTKPVN